MNNQLSEEIVYHVLANLGILPANFVNPDTTKSILDKQFLLSEKVTFEVDGQTSRKNIYGCQTIVTANKEFRVLVADCTQEKDLPEYCLLVQLKDSPAYGLYMVFNRLVDDPPASEVMIAVSMDQKHWMPCSMYLQATFLAGMEQIRDIPTPWAKCTDYQDQYQQLLGFIKFHRMYYEALDEREEV